MVVIFMWSLLGARGKGRDAGKLGLKLCWRQNAFRLANEPIDPRLTRHAASRTWGVFFPIVRRAFQHGREVR
jgi:hypothetical protein